MDSYPDYGFNVTSDSSGMNGNALFQCVATIMISIVYVFITCAIVFDRKRYQQPFLLTLLNFTVSYALSCTMKYFGEIHIIVYPHTDRRLCHTALFFNSILAEGSEMAIFPIFVDLIVQNMMPDRHEKRKYRVFMLIFILVIWLVAILKEIIYRSQSVMEFYCYESKSSGVMWTEFACIILRIIATMAAILFLTSFIFSKRPLSQILGSVLAPILIGLILCISNILTAIYQVDTMVGNNTLQNVALASGYLLLFRPIIFALLWLLHNNFRESIMNLVTFTPCRKTGPEPTEHEMRSDIA